MVGIFLLARHLTSKNSSYRFESSLYKLLFSIALEVTTHNGVMDVKAATLQHCKGYFPIIIFPSLACKRFLVPLNSPKGLCCCFGLTGTVRYAWHALYLHPRVLRQQPKRKFSNAAPIHARALGQHWQQKMPIHVKILPLPLTLLILDAASLRGHIAPPGMVILGKHWPRKSSFL